MALKSTICAIVHHACRTRAHCPTIVSSFKLSSGTICLPRFFSQTWSYIAIKIEHLYCSNRCIAALIEAVLCITLAKNKYSYGVVFHPHRFAAFCELTAVTIEGKQLDHISWNVREVPFQRAQRVSLSRRYGESNQVVLHVNRECYH